MNQSEFNTFLMNQAIATEVHADLFCDGTLMCGHIDRHTIHVYKENDLLHRLVFDEDTIVSHDAEAVWDIYKLCSARRHFAKDTSYEFATIITGMSDISFNFSPTEIIKEEKSNPLPKREDLKLSIADKDVLTKIRGEFHNVIETITEDDLDLSFLIDDSCAVEHGASTVAFAGNTVPVYDVVAIRSHIMSALDEGDNNYTFGDLVLELKQSFYCLERFYLNACKREWLGNDFDTSPEIYYSKDSFTESINELCSRALKLADSCTFSPEIIERTFKTIQEMADTYMTASQSH